MRGRATSTAEYYWDLLQTLVGRDIALRYRRSALGILWSLLNPLVSLIVFVFLFQGILNIHIPNYPVYVFCGLLAWNWFSTSVTAAAFTLMQNRDLVRKPLFPTESLVLVNVASNMVNYLLALPVLFGLALVSGVLPAGSLVALPAIILLQFLFTAGLCYFIAVLNLYFRDVEHLTVIVVGVWFYLTPVFYTTGTAARRFAIIFLLNPMAQLIEAYRAALLTHQWPDIRGLLWLIVAAVGMFVLGFMVFRRGAINAVDELG